MRTEKEIREAFLRKYRLVLKHRKKCQHWNAKPQEFCIECFGGGLTRFCEAITKLQDIDREWAIDDE